MVRRTWRYIKDNLTAVMLGLIVLLLLALFIIQVGYTQLTGAQFNNWLSPLINLGGFVAVIVTLLITRRDIFNRASQPFYEYHMKRIDEYVEDMRSIKDKNLVNLIQTDEKFKNRNIDLVNINLLYMNLYGFLMFDFPIKRDIHKLRMGENIDIDTFKTKEYHEFIGHLRKLQVEIISFYSGLTHIIKYIAPDKHLSANSKELLYRHIKNYILRQYIFLCTVLPNVEYYMIYDNKPEFEKFKSDNVLYLFTYLKSVPELKEAFIPRKYWK